MRGSGAGCSRQPSETLLIGAFLGFYFAWHHHCCLKGKHNEMKVCSYYFFELVSNGHANLTNR
jgi:hypothetical protein